MFRFPTGFTSAVHWWIRVLVIGWVLTMATHAFEARGTHGSVATEAAEMRVHEDPGESGIGLPQVAKTFSTHPAPTRFPHETPPQGIAILLAGPMDPPPRNPFDR